MSTVDFTKIVPHGGSQEASFEELVCQLAGFEPPQHATRFIRKNGAGGDAGVECLWVLKDGSEHAWQAKYFRSLGQSQWKQIDSSIRQALQKHPRITKYYVAVPLDLSDSRASKDNKPTKSSLVAWYEHQKEWSAYANQMGMMVDIVYIGKHELTMRLLIDTPHMRGKRTYFFDCATINTEYLRGLALRSKAILNERYTPEHHVDLPISQIVNSAAADYCWISDLNCALHNVESINIDKAVLYIKEYGMHSMLEDVRCIVSNARSLREFYSLDNASKLLAAIDRFVDSMYELRSKIVSDARYRTDKGHPDIDRVRAADQLQSTIKSMDSVLGLLGQARLYAYITKTLLIHGDAGAGKSHLLCDIAVKRVDQGLPVIFLLGQHYGGGDPIRFLANSLDMQSYSNDQVLGAIDSFGESCECRSLVIIDAINEGQYRMDWRNHLQSILERISEYKNIAVVLSCRSTYVNYLIDETLLHDSYLLTVSRHVGFKGNEYIAAEKYFAGYGLSYPCIPMLNPEFSNPLFLKLFCRTLSASDNKEFPRGIDGLETLFQFHLSCVDENINHVKCYRNGEKVAEKAIRRFAAYAYENDQIFGIPVQQARAIITECDPKPYFAEPLFDMLLNEGILSEDMIPGQSGGNDTECVRFTYEKYSDYFIASLIMSRADGSLENLREMFLPTGDIGRIIVNSPRYSGIITMLALCIAEKFQMEFIDLVNKQDIDEHDINWLVRLSFFDNILLRSPNAIFSRSKDLLNELGIYDRYDLIVALSSEPNHPWNAELLHRHLIKQNMADRDTYWSIYLAENDSCDTDTGEKTNIRILIDWPCVFDITNAEKERLKLFAVVLTWTLTTSNRKTRDDATKSLSRVFYHAPEFIIETLDKFENVNDPYVIQRLYAAAYGAIIYTQNTEIIKKVAIWMYNKQFINNEPTPDILTRDFARGIVEFAIHLDMMDRSIYAENIRSPYKSEWPIENPTKSELEAYEESGIKRSVFGFGDFGNYTMSCVHQWTASEIDRQEPELGIDVQRKVGKKLPPPLSAEYLDFINKQYDVPEIPFSIDEWLKIMDDIGTKESEETGDTDDTEEKDGAKRQEIERDELDKYRRRVKEVCDEKLVEEFEWANRQSMRRAAIFSRRWAQRWVCKKAYEMGWKDERFGEFERYYLSTSYDRSPRKKERIGKKFQWIALYELLARMADNLLWDSNRYEGQGYQGPWQLAKRNIDPSLWIRTTNSNYNISSWWQPVKAVAVEEELLTWLNRQDNLPDFRSCLDVRMPEREDEYIVMNCFVQFDAPAAEAGKMIQYWHRINACIIPQLEVELLKNQAMNEHLESPDILRPFSTGDGYLGEYPWHPYYQEDRDWRKAFSLKKSDISSFEDIFKHIPVVEYECEAGGRDFSITESVRFYIPSPLLIHDLALRNSPENPGEWYDSSGRLVFLDPSTISEGAKASLIKRDVFEEWMKKNEYTVVWLIGGEKQVNNYSEEGAYMDTDGWNVFNYMFSLHNGEITEGYKKFEKKNTRKSES